jgi:hypothetical protein
MKKIILTAIFATVVLVSANAQQFGLKGGINFATLSGDVQNASSRTSLHFGVTAEFTITDKFSIQPELLYSGQGYKYEEFLYKDVTKLDYINIPVMAKFYVAEGFSLEAGPQIGFLISAEEDWYENGQGGVYDIKNEIESTDFGLNFGAGYKLDNGLNFGVRYNLGLSNVYKNYGFNYDTNNSVLQISVGYFFN